MIEVYWTGADETVIRLDYYAPVESWAEFHQAVEQSVKLAASKAYPVAFLHNASQTPMPRGNPMNELRRAARTLPANTALLVMVVNNTFALHIVSLGMQILGRSRARLVATLEEAQQIVDAWQSAE